MQKINISLFGKVYDLSEELSSDLPVLKFGDKEYPINTSFKTVMQLDKIVKDNTPDAEFMETFLNIALGKKAAKELLDLNLPIKSYKRILKIIGDEFKGSDDESSSGNSN